MKIDTLTNTPKPILTIEHLDHFPYGKSNKVRFWLDEVNITRSVVDLVSIYWTRFCNSPGMTLLYASPLEGGLYAEVETGESFTEADLADCFEDVFKFEVKSKLYEGK